MTVTVRVLVVLVRVVLAVKDEVTRRLLVMTSVVEASAGSQEDVMVLVTVEVLVAVEAGFVMVEVGPVMTLVAVLIMSTRTPQVTAVG